jgi:hypothetical protein
MGPKKLVILLILVMGGFIASPLCFAEGESEVVLTEICKDGVRPIKSLKKESYVLCNEEQAQTPDAHMLREPNKQKRVSIEQLAYDFIVNKFHIEPSIDGVDLAVGF